MSRQEAIERIKPVTVGPNTGANMITSEAKPMTVPNLGVGKISITIENIIGKIKPVPMP